MLTAICKELITRKSFLQNKVVGSIYLGGGTPSLLTKKELCYILDTVRSNFNISEDVECTLEANPDDITKETLESWKSAGINRLSIGLQSFRDEDLKWMNRAHTAEESLKCVELAHESGFENLSVDLIYGLPDLTLEEWDSAIKKVIEMGVPHVSAYCLTVEQKTTLENWVKRGKLKVGSEDEQSDQFMRLLSLMEENDYEQYEISNFCKPNNESRHNSNYWKNEWYLGVGPSAHSFNGTLRTWNIANNHRYIKLIKAKEDCFEVEELSARDRFNEAILTGLRTRYGVEIDQLEKRYFEAEAFRKTCAYFEQQNWLYEKNGFLLLTREGKLRADHIASELFILEE